MADIFAQPPRFLLCITLMTQGPEKYKNKLRETWPKLNLSTIHAG